MKNSNLTQQELRISMLVVGGMTGKQICEYLYITPGTLKRHMKNIYNKLGLTGGRGQRQQLINKFLFQQDKNEED